MTLKLSILVQAITDSAKKGIDSLAGSTTALGKTTRTAAAQTQTSTRSLGAFGRAASGARSRLGALRSSVAAYIRDLRNVESANRTATGSVANLTAQFNDIGVMMAAGQNPLQLALQQGTQITQVLGPMGAAGAARALGSALVSMVNPVSLITIGSILAGAAMMQWLTGASDEAESLEERIDGLISRIEDYRKSAREGNGDLLERFGEVTPELLEFRDLGLELDRDGFLTELRKLGADGADALIDEMRGRWTSRGSVLDDLLPADTSRRGARGNQRQNRAALTTAFDAIDTDAGLEEQLAQVMAVRDMISAAADEQGNLNTTQMEFLRGWIEVEEAIRLALAAERETVTAMERKVTLAQEVAGLSRAESEAAAGAARTILEGLQQEAALRQAIRQFGEDSVQVAALRAGAERRVLDETLATLDVSESMKDEIRAAFDASRGIASVDMAGNISLAADEASRLFSNLSAALNLSPTYGARSVESGIAGGDIPDWAREDLPETDADRAMAGILANRRREARKPAKKSARGGSRASDYEREREAVSDLIAELQTELDVLRESDPVRKEMLRLRGELAGATEAETGTIADLIAQRVAETAQIEAQQSAYDFLSQTISASMSSIRAEGASVEDVFENITAAILDATIQAQLFGQGPFAGIFGTADSGGLIGGALKGLFPNLSTGGRVTGPGTGTSDSVPAFLSTGEFVVTAAATAQYGDLLEAMNAGQLASMQELAPVTGAAGGPIYPRQPSAPTVNLISPFDPSRVIDAMKAELARTPPAYITDASPAPGPSTGGQAPGLHVTIEITGSQTSTDTEDAAYRGMQRALDEYDRVQFPISFERQRREPWRR